MPAEELKLKNKEGSSIHVFSSYLAQVDASEKLVMYKVDMDLSRLYEAFSFHFVQDNVYRHSCRRYIEPVDKCLLNLVGVHRLLN